MVTIVIDRCSVHAGDDFQGHADRWVAPDGFRLGEVVLAAVERNVLAHFMGGGTWLIQAVHGGVVDDVARWGLEVDGKVGEREDLTIIETHHPTRQETCHRDGRTGTAPVSDGEEARTVRPMMSEAALRRRVVDAVRPGPGGAYGFFASPDVQHAKSWEAFRARMTMTDQAVHAEVEAATAPSRARSQAVRGGVSPALGRGSGLGRAAVPPVWWGRR